MSTDRELLEAAAKAAGIELTWDYPEKPTYPPRHAGVTGNSPRVWWNPLTDDGDALRLAVKLAIDIRLFGSFPTILNDQKPWVMTLVDRLGKAFQEPAMPDPAAATRRAIVRAAAALPRPAGTGD